MIVVNNGQTIIDERSISCIQAKNAGAMFFLHVHHTGGGMEVVTYGDEETRDGDFMRLRQAVGAVVPEDVGGF